MSAGSWQWAALDDVATVTAGNPAPQGEEFFEGGTHPFVRVQDLGRLKFASHLNETADYVNDKASKTLRLFPRGSILFTKSGASLLLNQRAILGRDMHVVSHIGVAVPGPRIASEWLYYWLRTVDFADIAHGANMPSLPLAKVKKIMVPVPPLEEQSARVAEIEKQFSRLDEAVANLKRVKANLKRYKAAVLKAAVEGRLVETEAELARREGRSYETGAQLLQRILETRRSQWQGKGKYKEPAAPDTTDLPELPEGWVWATADQLSDKITDGEHISPNVIPSGVPLLSAKDVRDFGVVFEDVKYVSPDDAIKFRSRCDPERGDILIVSRGATVGRACRVNVDQAFCLMGSVILMKLHKLLESSYALFALKAGFFLTRLTAVSGSTAQQAIYIRDIRPLPLPLPPLEEQLRIVAEVDRRLSLLRETEVQVNTNLQRAERMRQSILASAFSGGIRTTETKWKMSNDLGSGAAHR